MGLIRMGWTTRRSRAVLPFVVGSLVGALLVAMLPAVIDGDEGTIRAGGPAEQVKTAASDAAPDEPPPHAGNGPDRVAPDVSGSPGETIRTNASTSASPAIGSVPAPGHAEIGVSANVVRVGVLVNDLAGAARIGVSGIEGFSTEEQEAAFQAFFDEINDAGGVHGRRIEAVYEPFPAEEPDQRPSCVSLTEDKKVFAALGTQGYGADAAACITKEHRTPLLHFYDAPEQYYAQAQETLFSVPASSERMLRNQAWYLDRVGVLKGRKLGVVLDDRPASRLAVQNGLLPTLRDLGYAPVHVSTLSGSDLSTGASQIPVEVQQMRSKGADLILFETHLVYLSQFAQTADSQGWRPPYYLTDQFGNGGDVSGKGTPRGWKGFVVTSLRGGEHRAGRPEAGVDRACMDRYHQQTGQRFERGSNPYFLVMLACGIVDLFARTLRDAGPSPTRTAWSQAMQRLGEVQVPFVGGVTFGIGRFDGANAVRTARWDEACACWAAVDDFVRARY